MERKIRTRVNKENAITILMKLLPWLFMVLLYIAATSLGTAAASDGAIQSMFD